MKKSGTNDTVKQEGSRRATGTGSKNRLSFSPAFSLYGAMKPLYISLKRETLKLLNFRVFSYVEVEIYALNLPLF